MISFLTILLRLALALLLGAAIGLEREIRDHEAGMRTLALVSLGSALFTIISAYGFLDLLGIPHIQLDPTRIASYIVAGIGFLGGGTIFLSRYHERVKGLTTAACIWVIAAIGIACGAGLLLEAIATTIMVLIVLVFLRFVERATLRRRPSSIQQLRIEATSVTGPFISSVYDICVRNHVTIQKLQVYTESGSEAMELICSVSSETTLAKVIGELQALSGIKAIKATRPDLGDQ
jgi:putative Mg2+ transporter-C (MgtC) family protein